VFDTLATDRDTQYWMIDSTIVRAHQQAATGKGGAESGAGALPRWINHQNPHALDMFGRPLRLCITPGQASDVTTAPDLLDGQKAGAIRADNAYDSNDLRERIVNMNAKAVIRQSETAKSSSRVTPPSISIVIRSSDASAVLSISVALQRDTIAEPSTSQASSTSLPT